MHLLLDFYVALFSIVAFLTLGIHALAVRDTVSDISSTKGGVLIKNGKQTSCELGVIDSTAAFVAASCLDYSGNSVNETTNYQVYLDAGIDNTPAKYTVSSITVHPEYNATINLNPIAVLQFNKDSTEKWSNPIAIDRNNSWGDILFVRRGLTDIGSMNWETPLTVTNQYKVGNDCKYDYNFNTNENDLLCSNTTTHPPYTYLTNCAVPYGSVEVYISGKTYVAGIYVYTALLSGWATCTLQKGQNSIYLLLADYIAFASKVLGRSINYYPNSGGIAPQSDPGYSMTKSSSLFITRAIFGDLYVNQSKATISSSSSSMAESTSQAPNSSTFSSDYQSSDKEAGVTSGVDTVSIYASISSSEILSTTFSNTGENSSDNRDKGSKKVIIIGVVCGVLGGSILTYVLWFLYKRWRKAHRNIYRNSEARIDMQGMLVVDSAYNSMPASIYMPSTPVIQRLAQIPSPLRSSASMLAPISRFDRESLESLEQGPSPLYAPTFPSSSICKRQSYS